MLAEHHLGFLLPQSKQDYRKIKVKFGGSSARHNGIDSIDKFIGKDYSRVRVGIGHPKEKKKVNNHVLEDFKEDEEEKIKEIADNIVKLIPTLIEKKIEIDSSFPRYILENKDKLKKWIM